MTENEKVALLTEDPNVESCYGYNALLYIFGSKAAVIAANKGAAGYNLRKRQAEETAVTPSHPDAEPSIIDEQATDETSSRGEAGECRDDHMKEVPWSKPSYKPELSRWEIKAMNKDRLYVDSPRGLSSDLPIDSARGP